MDTPKLSPPYQWEIDTISYNVQLFEIEEELSFTLERMPTDEEDQVLLRCCKGTIPKQALEKVPRPNRWQLMDFTGRDWFAAHDKAIIYISEIVEELNDLLMKKQLEELLEE